MMGEVAQPQTAGLLVARRVKEPDAKTLAACARAMRAHRIAVSSEVQPLVDTCGTGGDRAGSFNISTAAALVTAACGLRVAKHGNRAFSGICGAADVLEACGVKVDLTPKDVGQCIEELGFGFMFAPVFHPAARHAGGPRRELGIRTIFNILGPITNPAAAEFQQQVARRIAIGALRYFLLKYTRASVIAFDFAEALSFEGETGPYVQYAAVRAASIFRKLGEPPDFSQLSADTLAAALSSPAGQEYWQLALLASQTDAVAEQALGASEPAGIAKFAFLLAQSFNNFYHRHPILREPDPQKKLFLLWLAGFVRSQLERTLDLLGIEIPEAM